jgi:hypothetical protein
MDDSPNGSNGAADPNGTPFAAMAPYNWEVHEQRWHRPAAWMAAHGASGKKIAQQFDKSEATISNLLRQSWFQHMVREEMVAAHKDIHDLFRAELINNLEALKEIRDDRRAPSNSRVLSVKEINDQALGRPVQPIQEEIEPYIGDPVEEVRRIEAELDRDYEERRRMRRLPG